LGPECLYQPTSFRHQRFPHENTFSELLSLIGIFKTRLIENFSDRQVILLHFLHLVFVQEEGRYNATQLIIGQLFVERTESVGLVANDIFVVLLDNSPLQRHDGLFKDQGKLAVRLL